MLEGGELTDGLSTCRDSVLHHKAKRNVKVAGKGSEGAGAGGMVLGRSFGTGRWWRTASYGVYLEKHNMYRRSSHTRKVCYVRFL